MSTLSLERSGRSRQTASLHVIPVIAERHCGEAAFLFRLRREYLKRADIGIDDLADLDERIESHLDGIRTAQERGWRVCQRALADAGIGEVFAAATIALQSKAWNRVAPLLAIVEADEALWPGLIGAFGWASAGDLQGTVKSLLASDVVFYRRAGLAACGAQRVDAGRALASGCADSDDALGRLSLRGAGELGRRDLLPVCLEQLDVADSERAFWAAWAAVLLGDRTHALACLSRAALSSTLAPGLRQRALHTSLRTLDMAKGHELLRALARESGQRRLMIEGIGVLGNALYVPWLIEQMADAEVSRLAGASFSLITGQDIVAAKWTLPAPTLGGSRGATPPADGDLDEDHSLPSPDPVKLGRWWQAEGSHWDSGIRRFLGESPSFAHCLAILKQGRQRHRVAAAAYLCLTAPGTHLFNVEAPAWRQVRLLEAT
jgi:uncharacterized protein (TIGR02270 family)